MRRLAWSGLAFLGLCAGALPRPAAAAYPGVNGRFVGSCEGIWVVNPDGTGSQTVQADPSARLPTWSPDGTRIAYIDTSAGTIQVMDADGSNDHSIGDGTNVFDAPTWSPDGSRIAVAVRPGGFTPPSAPVAPTFVDVMNADGTGRTTLLSSSSSYAWASPAWSPDGTWLAVGAQDLVTPGTSRIAIFPISGLPGASPTFLTQDLIDDFPAWSPDGQAIAFVRTSNPSWDPDVYRIGVNGTGLVPLTEEGTAPIGANPAWSPDGTLIAIPNLYTMNAVDGSAFTYVTSLGCAGRLDWQAEPTLVVPSPSVLDFGTQGLAVTSPTKAVVVTVSGSLPVSFAASTVAGADAGDFAVVSDGCGTAAPLPGGASCEVTVAFTPTLLGSRAATLRINDSASGSPQTVSLTGTGASLSFSPATLDFGSETQGRISPPTTVTVANRTSAAVTIASVSLAGTDAADFAQTSDTCTGTILAPLASCALGVTFEPLGLGARSATLSVVSTATDSPNDLAVIGTGIAPVAGALLAPASVDFGQVSIGSSSSAVTVTLTSNGTAPLVVTGVALDGHQPEDFTLGADTCTGTSLPPGQSCSVTVAYTPSQVCNATASLTVMDDAPTSPQGVSLSGRALAGPMGPYQTTLYCTSDAMNPVEMAAGADGRVWFDGRGGSTLQPGGLGAVSVATGVEEYPGAVRSGYTPYWLTFAPDGSYAYLEARRSGDPMWLNIVSSGGVKSQYQITDSAGALGVGPDGAFWFARLFSCGTTPLITRFAPGEAPRDYTPTREWLSTNIHSGYCAYTSLVTAGPDGNVWLGLRGGEPIPFLRSLPGYIRISTGGTFLDFTPGNVPIAATLGPDGNLYGFSDQTCNLERYTPSGTVTTVPLGPTGGCRTGDALATGRDGKIWLYGYSNPSPTATMLSVDLTSSAVASYPAPRPTRMTSGPDGALWFSAPPSAVGRFDIGGGPARAFVTPPSIGFPPSSRGVPSTSRIVTVSSTGTGPLTVSGVSLGGVDASEFVLDDNCTGTVLPPGTACAISVASLPTRAGSHTATLTIASDDTFPAPVVQLIVFSPPAPPVVSPAVATFPPTLVGSDSGTVTMRLTNPAEGPLAVASVVLGGSNAGDFAIVANHCPASLAAGATCTVTVKFAPTAAGPRTAAVTFTHNGNPPTQAVALSGDGVAGSPTAPCRCTSSGGFVDPVVVDPVAAATSPHGLFHLAVQQSGTRVSLLTITNAAGATVMTFSPPVDATWPAVSPWGFSPDDQRFVVHYASIGLDEIKLFDLTAANPSLPVWSGSLPIAPGGTATSPAGSIGFSPGGAYLVATQLQTPFASSLQNVVLNVVAASGALAERIEWSPPRMPSAPNTDIGSAFWGFGPDGQSFAFLWIDSAGHPALTLLALPSGTRVQDLSLGSFVASYVQFDPCGDVLAVVAQNATIVSPAHPVTISVYSTRLADANDPPIGTRPDLPVATTQIAAGPAHYTAELEGWTDTVVLAPNGSAGGTCPPPTASSPGGGSAVPPQVQAPSFTDETPPLTAVRGAVYTYTFAATGNPDPSYVLRGAPPLWLTIDNTTGEVSGTPPAGTTSFTYMVKATNARGFDEAGPFQVVVTAPGPTAAMLTPNGGGPLDPVSSPASLPSGNLLLLPRGRGEIDLPADVTPAVSIFTYSETDVRAGPLGSLTFAGLGFTFTAVNAATSAPVATLADPPRATIVFHQPELQAARIHDSSTLGLYWWSGAAWVNQLPCVGCGVDAPTGTLTALLTKVGEYVLAAAVPPDPSLTITPAAVNATAGVPFTGSLATFPPSNPHDAASHHAALVAWGDGQVAPGSISADGSGGFVVSGVHTWTTPGIYAAVVTVVTGGASQDVQVTAVVLAASAPPLFTAATPPLTATAGTSYSYDFAAAGVPTPTFALGSGAPTWLSMGATTGLVSGTPPFSTTEFSYSVIASNGVGPDAAAGPFAVTVEPPSGSTAGYYTVTPCRIFDSRDVDLGGPSALVAGSVTPVSVIGHCGIPSDATAVALNVTVTAPTGQGFLTLFPGGSVIPLASTVNYGTGQTRANNAIMPLGSSGAVDVRIGQVTGTVHVIVDVNGYFR